MGYGFVSMTVVEDGRVVGLKEWQGCVFNGFCGGFGMTYECAMSHYSMSEPSQVSQLSTL